MNLSGEQERHEEKEIVVGRVGLHHPGESCRDMPGMVAIVSAKEDFLSLDH